MHHVAAAMCVVQQLPIQVQHAAAFVAAQHHRFDGELGAQAVLCREEGFADLLCLCQLLQHVWAD
ncbi:hypothetical protein D3C78_1647160 [compost metagenome]